MAWRAGVDGDTAIVGLMARHPLRSATLWGQPYGSPLDGWVAAPFVALLGTTTGAVRLPYALLSLVLVAVAFLVGEAARRGAGLPAALLTACPPAYLLLMGALPAPLYPTTLVLLAVVLWRALRIADDLADARPSSAAGTLLLGGLAGLAVWTHLVSLAIVASVLLAFAAAARGRRTAIGVTALFVAGALVTSAPWWLRAVRDPAATAVLGLAHEGAPALAHAARVGARLHEPLAALLGAWTPLTVDEAERTVRAAGPAALGSMAGLVVLALAGLAVLPPRTRLLLGGAVAFTVLAFPFPVRSEPHTVRFLTPAFVPLAVLAGAGAVRLAGGAWAGWLVVPLCLAQLWTGARLLAAWRAAGEGALAPDCARVLDVLRASDLTRAYASYHTAYCLTYTSTETVIATQPWNERFYGHPLPYLDEVRGASRVAWVLVPGVDFELPSPRTFEAKLAGLGGRFTRVSPSAAVVYSDFQPPFGPFAAAAVIDGPAGDGDVFTRVTQPARGAATWALSAPVPTHGITLLAGAGLPALPRAFEVEVSTDGQSFERIARRRRGRETVDMAWINSHPQFLVDDLAFSALLDGRTVRALRITPLEPAPWSVGEILLHPAPPGPLDATALYRALLARGH